MKSRRSPALSLAVAALAVVGLGACTSTPSAKRVTLDVIESLEGIDDTARDCMLEVVERYTNEELEKLGEENPNFTSLDANLDNVTPEFREFSEALQACNA